MTRLRSWVFLCACLPLVASLALAQAKLPKVEFSDVGDAVGKYGAVEMFDADGKPVAAKTEAAPAGK